MRTYVRSLPVFSRTLLLLAAALGVLALVTLAPVTLAQAPTPVTVPTWRYDLTHAGQNIRETALTPANVHSSGFGKLFSVSVDGAIYAQPLYVPGLTMSDGRVHNVFFIATEHDSVYAFDADSNTGANAQPLWQISLLSTTHGASSGATTVPANDPSQGDIQPEIGITSTPVINPATYSLYVVGKTKESGAYFQRLHAIDIRTGAEQANSPVNIQATVPGTGNGSSGGQLAFSQLWQNNRSALNYYNGHVYLAFGSHGDNGPWHGWVLAYNAATLRQTAVLCLSPNGAGNGIWGAGAGLPIDSNVPGGRMFVVAGNGTFSSYPPFDANSEFGESIVAINLSNGALTPIDAFTPFDQATLTKSDHDQGSGGILMLDDQQGANPHLMLQAGKEGRLLLLNRDRLGGYAEGASSNTNAVQDIPGQVKGMWATPAYWNGNVYIWGSGDYGSFDTPKQFKINSGVLDTKPFSVAHVSSGYPGATFSVSSNGSQDGIAWAVRVDASGTHGDEVLYAFDATDVSKILWESDADPARESPGRANKFEVPVITNGKAYIAAYHEVSVYGLFNGQPVAAAPVISPNGGIFPAAQTVSLSSSTASASIFYTTDGSLPTPASKLYSGPITISTAATLRAIAVADGFLQSAESSAAFSFAAQTPPVSFQPPPGPYTSAQSVIVTDTDSAAAIYYTTDGSTPTASSTPYTSPIAVATATTVQAVAIDSRLQNSVIATATYSIVDSIDFSSGFASLAGLQLNGSAASTSNARLQLTNGPGYQAGSFFFNQPFDIRTFTTDFSFQQSNAVGDGFTFTIQNVGPAALGPSGSGLGYGATKPGGTGGMAHSMAVKFDLYSNLGEGTDSTGVYLNGASPTTPATDMTASGVLLRSGDVMKAHLTYDGATLSMALLDTVTGKRFSFSQSVNIPQVIGANAAYIGFTGSTGGAAATQQILTWTYAPQAPTAVASAPVFSPPAGSYTGPQNVSLSSATAHAAIYYTTDGTTPTAASALYRNPINVTASTTIKAIALAPNQQTSATATAAYLIQAGAPPPTINFASGFASTAGLSLNGVASVTNNLLQMTLATAPAGKASVWYSKPVSIASFTTDFDFQLLSPKGDGFTFAIQNAGQTALGPGGSGLGYGASQPGGTPGIAHSIAIKFDLYSNDGEGADSTGVYLNGASPTVPAIDMTASGVLLRSGHTLHAHITYDGTNLTLVLTDTATAASFTTSTAVNISSTVGAGTAYVGFTAATGGSAMTANILNWTLQ